MTMISHFLNCYYHDPLSAIYNQFKKSLVG